MTHGLWVLRTAALIALNHGYEVRIKNVPVNAKRITLILKTRALIVHDRIIDMTLRGKREPSI